MVLQDDYTSLRQTSEFFILTEIFSKPLRLECVETNKKEEFKVNGEDLLKKIKEIIHGGNVRKISIKNEKDKVLVEIPLTVGAIGVLIAPALVMVGALAALVTKCTIVVEKYGE